MTLKVMLIEFALKFRKICDESLAWHEKSDYNRNKLFLTEKEKVCFA